MGLFAGTALPDEARNRSTEAIRIVNRRDVDDLLNSDLDVLVDELVDVLEPALVRWDDVELGGPETTSANPSCRPSGRSTVSSSRAPTRQAYPQARGRPERR